MYRFLLPWQTLDFCFTSFIIVLVVLARRPHHQFRPELSHSLQSMITFSIILNLLLRVGWRPHFLLLFFTFLLLTIYKSRETKREGKTFCNRTDVRSVMENLGLLLALDIIFLKNLLVRPLKIHFEAIASSMDELMTILWTQVLYDLN